jgi:putative spermidine/putrescine transport system substrate-binding protein
MKFPFSLGQHCQKLAIALLALAIVAVGSTGVVSAQTNKVVMGVWGGSWGAFLRETINSFAASNGIDVVYVEANSNGLLAKVVAQRNSPQIDIYQGNETTMAQSKTLGVSAPLDTSIVTNMKDVAQKYRKPDEALIWAYWPVGFAYRSDEFKDNKVPLPDSWTALLRPDLKKKICLIAPPDLYGQATLIGLARAMGADQKDIGPVFGKLAALKANALTVVQNPGQAEDLLRAKECWMYPTAPARAFLMNQKSGNVGFIVPKESAVVSLNSLMLVKHGPNPTAAQKILDYLISVPVQEKMANFGVVMPTNTKAKASPEMVKYMGSIGSAGRPSEAIDGELAAKELTDWTSRWTQAFAQ